jgi:hypothetical protein
VPTEHARPLRLETSTIGAQCRAFCDKNGPRGVFQLLSLPSLVFCVSLLVSLVGSSSPHLPEHRFLIREAREGIAGFLQTCWRPETFGSPFFSRG